MKSEELKRKYSEFSSSKFTTRIVFEKKTGTYVKGGAEKSYKRITRVDKIDRVCAIVQQLIDSGADYFRQQQHVDNIAAALSNIKDKYNGKSIEMNFSENTALKTKQEVKEVHFSGKQYTLNRSVVHSESNKFVYHLSDDITHDPSFVYQVLEDIFDR